MARDDANHVVRLNLVKPYLTDDVDLECLETATACCPSLSSAALDNRFSKTAAGQTQHESRAVPSRQPRALLQRLLQVPSASHYRT
ncbi:hypothetical protein CGMCC3_g16423 [Colletotrichum fructicola]|nr:uncharacterized protein CGMCC3_g16423 [Colletotrichum fructicola]KAE9567458.1 hypothetical protein CGMCC3_g16423 [Colletotrichum fructicola]